MIFRRSGVRVDGGRKETTATEGGEEKEEEETVGWRDMGEDSSGEKVVTKMKQLVMIRGADFTDVVIANILYYITFHFYSICIQ